MPNAYKRQLKDKNQDYVYPVLDPADMDKKLDKITTGSNDSVYAHNGATQKEVAFTAAATANTLVYRAASGQFQVSTPTDNAHVATKKYVDDKADTKVDIEPINIGNQDTTILALVKATYPKGYRRWYTTTDGSANTITDRPTGTATQGFVVEAFKSRDNGASDYGYRLVCRRRSGSDTWEAMVAQDTTNITWHKVINTGIAGAVSTNMIADKNVTAAKIADSTITATQLASNAVTTAKIADKNVTAAKIANNTIGVDQVDHPGSGAWNGKVATISGNVLEVCKYIDFHNTNTSTNDYDTRLQCNGATKNVLTLPTVTGNLISTGTPTWSTIVTSNGADGTGTTTTLRGTSLSWERGNGGTVFRVTGGAGSIRAFKQHIMARFSTTLTSDIGVHNIKAGSTTWTYWAGASNGNYTNKSESHASDSGQIYGTALVTNGSRSALSMEIIGTKVKENDNTWHLHCNIMALGSATSFFANIECAAKDANSLPTLYQRGATNANTPFCRNVIEVLEE